MTVIERMRSERGAGLVEYALLVALIAVVCIAAVSFVGTSGSGKFDGAGSAITGDDGFEPCRYDPGSDLHWTHGASGETWAGPFNGPCP